MTTTQTPGTVVREIRHYLAANVHLSRLADAALDNAAIGLARMVLQRDDPSKSHQIWPEVSQANLGCDDRALMRLVADYIETDGGYINHVDAVCAVAVLRRLAQGGCHA